MAQMPGSAGGLWRQTPPAIFPPILGLLGLGLALRRAGELPFWGEMGGGISGVAELVLGAGTLLFGFALLAYLAKLLRRPAVVLEDLQILPGRTGLAACTMGAMLAVASVQPYAPTLAWLGLYAGLAAHSVLAVLVAWVLMRGPAELRRPSPGWHLNFVGFIVGGIAAVALGAPMLAWGLVVLTLPGAVVIWGLGAASFLRSDLPGPLRPLLMVHLAPACLYTVVLALLGQIDIAFGFGVFALLIALRLGLRWRWLASAGFTPLWGAFTFPVAAFASAMFLLVPVHWGFAVVGGGALLLACVVTGFVLYRVLRLWALAKLGPQTNAARA
ncbi:MAG: tellurium resistance protein [Paracoccaceae bacterium]|jgi:tellurite resistance protein|nr:tellurium resistance protein [Paracoccaceae bacterium]